jgi:hypothetical protein
MSAVGTFASILIGFGILIFAMPLVTREIINCPEVSYFTMSLGVSVIGTTFVIFYFLHSTQHHKAIRLCLAAILMLCHIVIVISGIVVFYLYPYCANVAAGCLTMFAIYGLIVVCLCFLFLKLKYL